VRLASVKSEVRDDELSLKMAHEEEVQNQRVEFAKFPRGQFLPE
jgi:hypothetical protein